MPLAEMTAVQHTEVRKRTGKYVAKTKVPRHRVHAKVRSKVTDADLEAMVEASEDMLLKTQEKGYIPKFV